MADLALHIPHILNGITDPLSFSDLGSCILVCRQWQSLFIPILWTDVVTFRSRPRVHWREWTYDDYSCTTHGQQALLKNGQYIRALTCYAPHSLQILRASNCVNLVEINYLLPLTTECRKLEEPSSGLEILTKLIDVSPQLRAISIEGMNLDDKDARDKLWWFLDFLDERPRISSVYFGIGTYFDNSQAKRWTDVWYRLMSRVPASTVHSVQVQKYITRSKRSLHGRRAWVGRESPIRVKIEDSDLRRERRDHVGGRWESEYRYPTPLGPGCTAVMEHNGHVVLGMPRFNSWQEFTAALARFKGIQNLKIDAFHISISEFLASVPKLFPSLTSLDISNYQADQKPVDNFLGNLVGLTSLSLCLCIATQPDWKTFSRHYSVMTSLSLTAVPLDRFYGIVSGCPVLQELAVSWLEFDEPAPVTTPQWICPLRKLHLDIAYGADMDYFGTEHEIAAKIDQGNQFAERAAPSFMSQLGTMALLKDLRLGFHSEDQPDVSPFLELSLDPSCGLPQLFNMRDLRSVAVSGLRHNIGQDEIEWMKRHWPRLHSLEVPIMQELPYVGGMVVEWRDTYKGQVPEYDRWFAGLEVVVPDHCYSILDHTWFRFVEEFWEWKDKDLNETSSALVQ